MIREAAAAGRFRMKRCTAVPRLQIVTVEEALARRDRAVHLPLRRSDALRPAARETGAGAQAAFDL